MNLIRYHIILLILVSTLFASYSQSKKFYLADLKDKTWNLVILNASYKEYYQNDKVIFAVDEKYAGRMEYYLSDSICRVFDPEKVGNVLSGNYIIRRPLRDKKHPGIPLTVSCYEIIDLNPARLILKNKKDQRLEFEIDSSVIFYPTTDGQ